MGTTGFSYTTSWGESEQRSETIAIGTTSGVETELQPGQAATAVLSANKGALEVEVVYLEKLRGNVAANFKIPYKRRNEGHHFLGPSIDSVMKSGGLENEVIIKEKIDRWNLLGFQSSRADEDDFNVPDWFHQEVRQSTSLLLCRPAGFPKVSKIAWPMSLPLS
ncbi:unnamed protein product [Parnassius apollo]|uniref:(apollo) hypothetical protein n=1 Tax=Parnassius apollo TaxID=110799 RepID=A0A8S3WHB0_PARAO|nr:unnamed protein product [Parnassius apollo]